MGSVLSKVQHLAVTWLLRLVSNMSALWILVANGWMQNPVSSVFNYETMRMELVDFGALIFNPVAQVKFVHTVLQVMSQVQFCPSHFKLLLTEKRDMPFCASFISRLLQFSV